MPVIVKLRLLITLTVLTSLCTSCQTEPPIPQREPGQPYTIHIPLNLMEGAVSVTGQTETPPTAQDMNLFALQIKTSVPDQNSYLSYANGLWSTMPDSLEITLISGNDYQIFAGFYQNELDSISPNTFGFLSRYELSKMNQLQYGDNQISYDETRFFQGTFPCIRTSSSIEYWLAHPAVNFYYTSAVIYDSIGQNTMDTLQFRQYNNRYDIAVSNANPSSRILLSISGFGTLSFTSDSNYVVDLRHVPFYQNQHHITISHEFEQGENTFNQVLYNNTIIQDRLKSTRIEVNTPDPQSDSTGSGSTNLILIEENFVPGDTIQVGG